MSIGEIKLNSQQKLAVEYGDGPLLIVAGAGTGKTTVLTQRVYHLIKTKNLQPENVLALTFTEKSAKEMEERIDRMLPYGYSDLWVMTFHSFCQKILEESGIHIGIPSNFRVLDETGIWMMIRKNLDKFDLDYYRPLGNPIKFIKELIKHFSRCKDELISTNDYLSYAEKLRLNKDLTIDENADFEVRRIEELANAYHTYQNTLLENDVLDFGDLINYTIKLFRERPNILEKYKTQFQYILVDEFQDTNYAQYELIKILSNPKNNITVVGDDDQCLPGNSKISSPTGEKQIKNIQVGDEVLSAIGKGHVGISRVNHVFKNKKSVNFLTIKTKKGFSVKVTDNHKMFCHVPSSNISGSFFYVYLMWRNYIGWRIGITKNLSWRLSLERSADKIVGIKSCKTEEEARFYEQLYSLKYSIPTYCFKHRKGLVMYEEKLKELYKQLNVDAGLEKLTQDLNIDLNSFHVCLSGVVRSNTERIKINLNLCQRRYRSKDHVKNKRELMKTYLIQHEINIQTSSKKILDILFENGYKLEKANKGKRLRIVSNDLSKLKKDLSNLEKITGGIVQAKAKIGKLNYQTLPAIVMPAKNLLLGHYLPVKIKNEIIYDEIIEIKKSKANTVVYDLEIDKTHNFLAENFVVHNSIYAFRGSSMNNILGFKKDYKNAKEIFITDNYRSTQNILDLAYGFIELNNPNRLEIKLAELSKNKKQTLSKKLKSHKKENADIETIVSTSEEDEARDVIEKIYGILKREKNISWSDFAILVRSNSQAIQFIRTLDDAQIPYNFVASSGLYEKEIVQDIISYLKLLDDYHESTAMWRVLNFKFFDIDHRDLVNISHMARKKSVSIFEIIRNHFQYIKLVQQTSKSLDKIVNLIEKHTKKSLNEKVWNIIWDFLNDSGYLKWIDSLKESEKQEIFSYLNSFYKKVKNFEKENVGAKIKDFLEFFALETESGDKGKLPSSVDDGPESVKIMTVHGSKGLEFDYVFIVGLVDKRFPSIERSETIPIPDDLVKEQILEGDVHLEEERRLFYVAMTRARKGLYFTRAIDYGGVKTKKASRFLHELNLVKLEQEFVQENQSFYDKFSKRDDVRKIDKEDLKKLLPKQYSFSQIAAYESCPRQYYYSHILKIPSMGKHVFSYGKSMHSTLQKFFQLHNARISVKQESLFDKKKMDDGKIQVSLDELIDIYKDNFIDDWYENEGSKKKYFEQGKNILKQLYNKYENNPPSVKFLEKGFNMKIGNYSFKGSIDRVDKITGGVELIDYKTGKPKSKLTFEEKQQLIIYQIAYQDVFKEKVVNLKFYYLDDNSELDFIGNEKDIQKAENKILTIVEKINSCDFRPKPSEHTCRYCDFNNICPFREG